MHKVDNNQKVLGQALAILGYSFLSIANVGSGAPDAIVGGVDADGNRRNLLVEIKNPVGGRMLPAQVDFRLAWRGVTPLVVYHLEDILHALGFRVEWLAQWRAIIAREFGESWFDKLPARAKYLSLLRRVQKETSGAWQRTRQVWQNDDEIIVESV